jgi:hypothetical protein
MAFGIWNPNKYKTIPKIPENPPNFTISEYKPIVFPINTLNELDNIGNFTLSYYKDQDTEVPIEHGISFDNGKGIFKNTLSDKNGNLTNVRLFQNCFDISAEFSIKIVSGTKLTNLLCFEYNPENTEDLQDFVRSVGNFSFRHTGGSLNCMMLDYNNQTKLVPKVLGTILVPDYSDSNFIQYCGKIAIDCSEFGQPDADGLYTTNKTILLKLSAFLTYIIV